MFFVAVVSSSSLPPLSLLLLLLFVAAVIMLPLLAPPLHNIEICCKKRKSSPLEWIRKISELSERCTNRASNKTTKSSPLSQFTWQLVSEFCECVFVCAFVLAIANAYKFALSLFQSRRGRRLHFVLHLLWSRQLLSLSIGRLNCANGKICSPSA